MGRLSRHTRGPAQGGQQPGPRLGAGRRKLPCRDSSSTSGPRRGSSAPITRASIVPTPRRPSRRPSTAPASSRRGLRPQPDLQRLQVRRHGRGTRPAVHGAVHRPSVRGRGAGRGRDPLRQAPRDQPAGPAQAQPRSAPGAAPRGPPDAASAPRERPPPPWLRLWLPGDRCRARGPAPGPAACRCAETHAIARSASLDIVEQRTSQGVPARVPPSGPSRADPRAAEPKMHGSPCTAP